MNGEKKRLNLLFLTDLTQLAVQLLVAAGDQHCVGTLWCQVVRWSVKLKSRFRPNLPHEPH